MYMNLTTRGKHKLLRTQNQWGQNLIVNSQIWREQFQIDIHIYFIMRQLNWDRIIKKEAHKLHRFFSPILKFFAPYLLTIACRVHQVCHRKSQHPTDLPIKVCILLLQAEPSSAYPLQAPLLLAIGTGTADQFQLPAMIGILTTRHLDIWERYSLTCS